MENIDILKEIVVELDRFRKKLAHAIKEQSTDNVKRNWSNRNYASCRRAALDLKIELTKITQDTKYKYAKK